MPGPDPNAAPADPNSRAWLTLITRASYLPGLVLLLHSLYQHGSKHPIIVQYTDSLPEDCIKALGQLKQLYPLCRPQKVDPIAIPDGLKPVASRFADTLTKLRVFEPIEGERLAALGFDRSLEQLCFLDADILIRRNLDDVFDIRRPGPDWIAVHPACSCNADGDPLAPSHWVPENCPCTPLKHPEALDAPIIEPKTEAQKDTYSFMNSGVFVLTPSKELWERMEHFRLTDPRVQTFRYPDQNFLDTFFKDKWIPIGWQYNAMKTIRYWHPALWRDEEVRCLHYVVDKPWEARTGKGEEAGYLGKDGETHYWWWQAFDEWKAEAQKSEIGVDVLACVERCLVPKDASQNRVGGRELLERLGKLKKQKNEEKRDQVINGDTSKGLEPAEPEGNMTRTDSVVDSAKVV
ncbi:hypothetical protein AC578_7101 [Pseudocercospora eumusae]|uniref:Glycosyltransferase family 8 protein n=1 Tax=Pseudocercospora eumusae TaxID=321146 RepID=A0A139HWU0_9PEZI|nr:hypothetical protein AC578_7101 [Pseudocercospora eumusae]